LIDGRQSPKQAKNAFPRQWAGLKPLKRFGGAAMMAMNLALPSEHLRALDQLIARENHIQQRRWQLSMAGLTDNNQPKAAEEEMVRTTMTMGKDSNNNGQGRWRQQRRLRQRRRRVLMVGLTVNNQPKAAEEEMARRTTTTGKDGNNNGQGRQQWEGRRQWGQQQQDGNDGKDDWWGWWGQQARTMMSSMMTKGAISGGGGHGDEGVVGCWPLAIGRWSLGAFVGKDPT
jgi:hypothetical protein